jgi:hypothetical protein
VGCGDCSTKFRSQPGAWASRLSEATEHLDMSARILVLDAASASREDLHG